MDYVVDFNPVVIEKINYEYLADIENKIFNNQSVSREEINYFLDVLCYLVRLSVDKRLINFDYKCDLFQSIFAYYFEQINCETKAYMTQNVITKDIVGHSFLVVKVLVDEKDEYYLIDPSYIQFFKKEKCSSNNYFVNPNSPYQILLTPDPGYFIKEDKKDLAEFLLNHGYSVLNEEVAQMYGDSFFNTKVGGDSQKLSFQSVPGSIYFKSFLKGNEVLSKSEEELYQQDLLITPFSDLLYEFKLK